jgi:hypothetical protein
MSQSTTVDASSPLVIAGGLGLYLAVAAPSDHTLRAAFA